ncbi:type II secretion system protein [Thiohalophilus sp.]|uniref:type IV pilus modification PilV family protein n=1 Tax=Thiohalophilus sp. TaxID=3028392 RepID=UPI002ACEE3CD|nr:type II secretion system protein [Thiohalophilus sp.]MDZ7661483.1 type II secretion system protein [Thiohalophilus sp.]
MTVKHSYEGRVTRDEDGFTLVEMVVFIVVLAVGLSGVVLVINRTLLGAPEALVNTRAMEIAQLYLDEIGAKKYDENTPQGGVPPCDSPDGDPCTAEGGFGPDGSEARDLFDDVDDYHNPAFQPATDADDNPLPNYSDYDVSVSISYAGTDLGFGDDRLAKRIDLIVRTPRNQQIPVTVYRTNF